MHGNSNIKLAPFVSIATFGPCELMKRLVEGFFSYCLCEALMVFDAGKCQYF